jgi:ribosome-binding protein aMBF1 (putative translation factor)
VRAEVLCVLERPRFTTGRTTDRNPPYRTCRDYSVSGVRPAAGFGAWAERLVRGRNALGLTQNAAAARIGVDACTLARWERGEREPEGLFLTLVTRFLAERNEDETAA